MDNISEDSSGLKSVKLEADGICTLIFERSKFPEWNVTVNKLNEDEIYRWTKCTKIIAKSEV